MSTLGTQSGRDNLIAGDFPIVTDPGTILTGQNIKRGTLMGQITASKKWIKSLSAASDGSEVPSKISAIDVDASSADVETTLYSSGEFNQNQVIYGTGHTIASVKKGLRALSIFLKDSIQA
jgi:hypothetical protein